LRPELEQPARDWVGNRGAFRRRGHAGGTHLRRYLAKSFVRQEEEGPVQQDGTAQRAAELVPVQRTLLAARFVGKEVRRIQLGVTKVFERRSMKLVAAALGDDVDLGAGAAAELRQSHAGLDREFLD